MARLVQLSPPEEKGYSIHWDSVDCFIHLRCFGVSDHAVANRLSSQLRLIESQIGPYRILCDNKKAVYITRVSNQIYIDMFKRMKFFKIAILNSNEFLETVVTGTFSMLGIEDYMCFTDETRAIEWLNSPK